MICILLVGLFEIVKTTKVLSSQNFDVLDDVRSKHQNNTTFNQEAIANDFKINEYEKNNENPLEFIEQPKNNIYTTILESNNNKTKEFDFHNDTSETETKRLSDVNLKVNAGVHDKHDWIKKKTNDSDVSIDDEYKTFNKNNKNYFEENEISNYSKQNENLEEESSSSQCKKNQELNDDFDYSDNTSTISREYEIKNLVEMEAQISYRDRGLLAGLCCILGAVTIVPVYFLL